jgi:hypothetical protein
MRTIKVALGRLAFLRLGQPDSFVVNSDIDPHAIVGGNELRLIP